MIDRAIKLKKPLIRMFDELMDDDNSLYDCDIKEVSKEDWSTFAEVSRYLTPFKDATVSSSGDSMTTLSLQVPWYDELLTGLEAKKVLLLYAFFIISVIINYV